VGLPVFFLGYLTLFFGIGIILVLAGLALYAFGIDRTKVVDRHAIIYAVTLLALGFPVALALHSQLAGIELAVASAWVMGFGIWRSATFG